VAGDADPTRPAGWAGALLAILVISVVSDVLIFAAISISEHRVTWRLLPEMLAMSVPFCVGTAAIALVAVRAFWHDPVSMLLLVPPVLLVLAGYRALSAARRDRSNIAFLHQVSTLLHSQEGLEPVLEEFLATSRSTFRADVAELTLLGPGEVTTARCVGAKPRVEWEVLSGPDRAAVDELVGLVGEGRLLRSHAGRGGASVATGYARARGLHDLMAVALEGDRLHGVLLVGHTEGAVTTFDEPDATLLRTLASQVGRVLDNGHLEQSLVQVTELKEQLAHRANHDHLTGLANRSRFLDLVRDALDDGSEGEPDGGAVSVLYLDLDGFKAVNDTFGHDTGDALLQIVAARLRACVRTGDVVARLGGDEFAVVILHPEDADDLVLATADRIRALVCEPVQLQDHVMTVGTSIGIATTSVPASLSVDELISRADSAMYVAKRGGGSRHVSYADGVAESTCPTYTGNDLLTGLEQGQVFVHYQPIIDLSTGDLLGAEALARWQHPVHGLVPPDVFVPLAESTGHNARLARHVMRQACRDSRRWLELPGAPDLFVTVNLSATQLADQDLLDDVVAALEESGLDARHLMLETTESMLMRDPHTAVQTLAALKEHGVRLAIDDFGTGYSSLAYLRQFSVDILKIAREFTAELSTGPDDDAVTRAIIQLSRTLGLRTIAEGIETSEQHSRLTELGCEWGQGFLFARPMPHEEMRDLVLFSPRPVRAEVRSG
jgi:diguanylate cyclase (GGDEF)-like protein